MSDFYVFGYARDKAHYRGKKSFEPKYAITDAPRNSFHIPLISLKDAESVIAQRDVEITLLRKQVEALENADGAEKGDSIKGNQCVPQLRKMEGTKGSAKKMGGELAHFPTCLAISPRRTVEKTVPVYLPDEKGDDHDSDT